jgi:hypothetical protein
MTDFELRVLARQVIDEDSSEDFGQILKELRRRIPDDLVGEALDQALVPFMHDMIRKPGLRRPPAETPAPGDKGRARSPKLAGIREAWRRSLDAIRYTVADGSVRRIGDMSRDDVIFVASQLEELAAQNEAKAALMRRLAAAMDDGSAARVRDLPDETLREWFA